MHLGSILLCDRNAELYSAGGNILLLHRISHFTFRKYVKMKELRPQGPPPESTNEMGIKYNKVEN